MKNEILICLEGSPSGDRALELGVAIALQVKAGIVGLAIVDEPDIRAGAPTGIGGGSYKKQRDDALVEDAEAQVAKWLSQFLARSREAGLAGRALEEHGRPVPTILQHMPDYDLTLMGRHANFKFETVASDPDTRDKVLNQAKQPLIVVPEDAALAAGRVLVAFDGSSAAKRAIASFAKSGLCGGDEVHVVSIDDDGATAYEMASRGAELFGELGIKAKPMNVVSVLSIAEAIIEACTKLHAHLIVMGAYTQSRLSQMIWGSVTRELVEKTHVPLYLQH